MSLFNELNYEQDGLLTQLSRISALRVISRTSMMGYALQAVLTGEKQQHLEQKPTEKTISLDPSFKNMRDLPRFQVLDQRYRQWLEQLP